MRRKQLYIFASIVIILATPACQSSANPLPSPDLSKGPAQPGEVTSTVAPPTSAAVTEDRWPTPAAVLPTLTMVTEDSLPALPPGFLADPNTACAVFRDRALSCLDRDGWHVYEKTAFKPSYIADTITHCPDERIYLTMLNEVYELEGETLIDLGEAYGAETFACGYGEEIWTGDMDGVSYFDGVQWTRYPAIEIFGSNGSDREDIIYSMAVAPNGNVWVTTTNRIATFDGISWKILTPPGDKFFLESFALNRGMVVDTNGNVWVIVTNAESGEGELLKYDGSEWSSYSGMEYEIRFIVMDHKNRIWAATQRNRIYIYDQQTRSWDQQFGTRQFGVGYSSYALNTMQFDRQERLWVATDYGLEIFDGKEWITYHMYTADLYANEIDDLLIFGAGPRLLAPSAKEPGSVLGRLVNQESGAFVDALAEICLEPEAGEFLGETPCGDQAYHALTHVGPDGNFQFLDVPAGRYYLMAKLYNNWGIVVSSDWSPLSMNFLEFEVKPGAVTQLGEIISPPD